MSFSIKSCGLYKKPLQKSGSDDGEFSYLFDEKSQTASTTSGPNPTDPKHGGHCIHVSSQPVNNSGPTPKNPKYKGHCIHSSTGVVPDTY